MHNYQANKVKQLTQQAIKPTNTKTQIISSNSHITKTKTQPITTNIITNQKQSNPPKQNNNIKTTHQVNQNKSKGHRKLKVATV